jgi:serine/threonine protein kinase
MVMEYYRGGDLFELVSREQGLDPRRACRYFTQMIHGLQYMRSHGIVHRYG